MCVSINSINIEILFTDVARALNVWKFEENLLWPAGNYNTI